MSKGTSKLQTAVNRQQPAAVCALMGWVPAESRGVEQIASGGGSMDPLRRELDRPRLRRQVSPGQAAAAAGESTTVRQLRIAELLHVRDDLSGGEGPQD